MAWPERLFRGTPRELNFYHLHLNKKELSENPEKFRSMHKPGQKWLMGYSLPPFQRPVVWEEDRMVKFIESAVLGLHLGTWVYNASDKSDTKLGRVTMHITDQWLIDGQQRLTALDRFFDDAFPVFGEKWSEVDKIRQRHFLMSTAFTAYETRIEKVNELQDLYNRLAFGGIPHTPADIATDDAENLTVPGIR